MQEIQITARRLWDQLGWTQRGAIIGISVVTLGAVYFLFMWASAPSYAVLFSNLSNQDAGAITTQLDSAKVPYQLSNGGATIMVPSAQVDAERLKLANQGLPSSGVVGFSLFDKTSIFQGDSFTEQINYTRALEGELTQTISQVQGVQSDTVNIVLPQQDLFSSDQAQPTASVLLKMGIGGTLSSGQIAGIQHLVASAVQGLKPDAVTIVDGNGTILSNNAGTDTAAANGLTALQAQARYESNLEAQLGAMLDTVVGPNKAVVRVNADMNWTQSEATGTVYVPQSKTSPITASKTSTNLSVGPSSANTAGGTAGVASNAPTYGAGASITGTYTQTQKTADITYAPSMTTTHVLAAPGTLDRLSVAVVLDGVTNTAEVASIRQAISAAVGLQPTRGDQLSITSVPFDQSATKQATAALAAQQQRNLILSIARWAALIIVPLVLLFLLRRLLVPARLRAYQTEQPGGVRVLEHRDELAGAIPVAALPGAQMQLRQSLAAVAREKPEVLAGMIGRWIEEDRP
jgi:flagellar M-ring protein FliF